MGLFFAAFVLWACAGIVFSLGRSQRKPASTLSAIAQTPLSQLSDDCENVRKEIGPGSFRQAIKVRGTIECSNPIVSELSQTPCVFYRFSVTREYEELVSLTGNGASGIVRRVRKSEVVAQNERSVPFRVNDGGASLEVDPASARIEGVKTHDQFRPHGAQVRFGSFSLDANIEIGGTLGYRYREEILGVGDEVSVVAEAGDESGTLRLRVADVPEVPFWISAAPLRALEKKPIVRFDLFTVTSSVFTLIGAALFLIGVIR